MLLLICFAMAELPGFDSDPSRRRLQINSMNSILQFSTTQLNLTLALIRDIPFAVLSYFITIVAIANPLLNRQRTFARGGRVHGGELKYSYFFFSP